MKHQIKFVFPILFALLISSLWSCKPEYDEYMDYMDGAWIVEEFIVNDPMGHLANEEALTLDQEKTKFYFDYGGKVRTPMGKRSFRFKEDHQIIVIGEFEYLFEKIDDDRCKLHHVRHNGEAEVIYILKRIPEE